MDLPLLDKGLLAKMGIAPTTVPMLPAPISNFGINFERPRQETPKSLTADECIKLFGVREAVLMNFIPQMMTALALEQAGMFIRYCSNNRISSLKRTNRELRKCIEEYNYELKKSYGSSWLAYVKYLKRLREEVDVDIFKCLCTFRNEASRHYIGSPHIDIIARVMFVKNVIDFVEQFDQSMDKMIANKIKAPCRRTQDPYCFLISVMCMDMIETFWPKMQTTDVMTLCIKVLVNRCHNVVDAIMADEDSAETSNK